MASEDEAAEMRANVGLMVERFGPALAADMLVDIAKKSGCDADVTIERYVVKVRDGKVTEDSIRAEVDELKALRAEHAEVRAFLIRLLDKAPASGDHLSRLSAIHLAADVAGKGKGG